MYLLMYQRHFRSSDSSSSTPIDVYEVKKSATSKAIEDAKTWKDKSKANAAIVVHQKKYKQN